jgi:predicted phosphoribosyltransferase
VVVDDGLATGLTAHAVLRSLARDRARQILLGAPVGSSDAVRRLAGEADAVVCPRQPEPFIAVSLWYEEFPQTSDAEVVELLELSRTRRPPRG